MVRPLTDKSASTRLPQAAIAPLISWQSQSPAAPSPAKPSRQCVERQREKEGTKRALSRRKVSGSDQYFVGKDMQLLGMRPNGGNLDVEDETSAETSIILSRIRVAVSPPEPEGLLHLRHHRVISALETAACTTEQFATWFMVRKR